MNAVRFIAIVDVVVTALVSHHTQLQMHIQTHTDTHAQTVRLYTYTNTYTRNRQNNANNKEAKWLAVSLYSIVIVNGLLQIETPNQRGH